LLALKFDCPSILDNVPWDGLAPSWRESFWRRHKECKNLRCGYGIVRTEAGRTRRSAVLKYYTGVFENQNELLRELAAKENQELSKDDLDEGKQRNDVLDKEKQEVLGKIIPQLWRTPP
jgi:hypothetical protein